MCQVWPHMLSKASVLTLCFNLDPDKLPDYLFFQVNASLTLPMGVPLKMDLVKMECGFKACYLNIKKASPKITFLLYVIGIKTLNTLFFFLCFQPCSFLCICSGIFFSLSFPFLCILLLDLV